VLSKRKHAVLVVEDEPLIRMCALDFVRDAGFEAIEAANADDAIEILGARDDIGVVFTDVNMPGSMDGLKLAAVARGRWPPIDFIVTSGRLPPAANDMPDRGLFLAKPYTNAQLARALTDLTTT
jgi:CheY-like chemotaxis protein